ncbi:unnamed protein product [Chondrus crispus]|uniref:Uncharacterized protein n=1 Tax=Chondrus crispus TaxID=2769 RepID=R7QC96_CHOCR|nr:unnamed protein product [Chondrus crispus]CDF36127.1 unnamed protein product [Chondrus crispus]|eukprot:XP_005715946.1 unnamed protein product [Chondrus crispus]
MHVPLSSNKPTVHSMKPPSTPTSHQSLTKVYKTGHPRPLPLSSSSPDPHSSHNFQHSLPFSIFVQIPLSSICLSLIPSPSPLSHATARPTSLAASGNPSLTLRCSLLPPSCETASLR